MGIISLKKKAVTIVLEKKKLTGVVAKVGIVRDISESKRKLYGEGVVQEVVEQFLCR